MRAAPHADDKAEKPTANTTKAAAQRDGNEHAQPPVTPVPDLAEIKAWTRRELHLVANGASEAERETLNP